MNCFAHIFIGKEFEQLVQNIGRVTYKFGDSAVSYLHYYLLDTETASPVLKKLSVTSDAPNRELDGTDAYVRTEWIEEDTQGRDLTAVYRMNIFNPILGGVNKAGHNCLYVCLHFPFYKKSAFGALAKIYAAMRAAQMPDKISFTGYCSDLAEMISPSEKNAVKLAPAAQIEAYEKFRKDNDVMINQHLLLFHNSFQNGMPLNLTEQSLADVVSLLATMYVDHYDEFYPDTVEYADMISFGVSAISLDKYMFVDYLFRRTILHQMDAAQVTCDSVSVNEVFDKVKAVLSGKEHVLGEYLARTAREGKEARNILDAEKYVEHEAQAIVERCEEIFKANRSMPMRAALLAALLQTKCDLFSQMVFDPDSPDWSDMYAEPIDYFLNNDKSHFYWADEQTPLENPVKELKRLNMQLINSESQIRELEKTIEDYGKELENTKEVDKVTQFGEDGYFRFDDRKYKLLPAVDEEPLQETYQPHEIHVASLDLRNNFRGVQDQGQQGSCLAFALTSVFEYVMRSNNRTEEYDLSEAFLYYNARKLDDDKTMLGRDSGSRFKPAVESLCQYGIAVESLCRYDQNTYDREPSAEAYEDAKRRLLRKAVNVSRTVADVKSALEDGYPVAASFMLYPSFSATGADGFVPMPSAEEIEALANCAVEERDKHSCHAMVIVGFDDSIECFLVRNSWGTDWGNGGYCYVPYSYVADERLMNFACILTEVESIEHKQLQVGDIPVMKLDDTDICIRFHTALAALQREKKAAAETMTERNVLALQLEHLKQKLSNHNDCETYINRTCDKTREEQEELREKIKQERKTADEEYDLFQKVKKKLTYKAVGYTAGILLVVWIYNRIMRHIASYKAVKDFKETLEYIFRVVHNWFVDEQDADWHIDLNLTIEWMHYVVIVAILGLLYYKGHKAWKQWREKNSEHERQIGLLEKQIAAKQSEIDAFRFNSQTACRWIAALNRVQTVLQGRYAGIVSRINNLRAWHANLENAESVIELQSAVPYTTLLDKDILDAFFEKELKNSPDFTIDFAEDLGLHQITEEYLMQYQTQLRDKIMTLLATNKRLADFNISAHIVADEFADIARKVSPSAAGNEVSTDNVKRQSEVFMHVRPTQRGIIMPSTYLIAPDCQKYARQLRQKFGYGLDTFLTSDNACRLTMLQIISLKFDECVIFQ